MGDSCLCDNTGSGWFVILYLDMTYQILEMVSIFWNDSQLIHAALLAYPSPPPLGHFVHCKGCWSLWHSGSFVSLQDSDSYVVIEVSSVTVIVKMVTSIHFLIYLHVEFLFTFVPHSQALLHSHLPPQSPLLIVFGISFPRFFPTFQEKWENIFTWREIWNRIVEYF